jgi:heterodisulfide reductase subunit B
VTDEWTCGHVAGGMCAECYRVLAAKAHELVEQNDQMRDRINDALKHLEFHNYSAATRALHEALDDPKMR